MRLPNLLDVFENKTIWIIAWLAASIGTLSAAGSYTKEHGTYPPRLWWVSRVLLLPMIAIFSAAIILQTRMPQEVGLVVCALVSHFIFEALPWAWNLLKAFVSRGLTGAALDLRHNSKPGANKHDEEGDD